MKRGCPFCNGEQKIEDWKDEDEEMIETYLMLNICKFHAEKLESFLDAKN